MLVYIDTPLNHDGEGMVIWKLKQTKKQQSNVGW